MKIKKYQILPHPAEWRLKISGRTLEKLFINAAEAMANVQKKNITSLSRSWAKCCKKTYKEKIKIQSIDLNSLLVDFLSEILAKSQINKCIYLVSDVKCQASDVKAELTATLSGFPVKRFEEDIKAITYEDLNVRKARDLWQTQLVLDI